MSHMNFEFWQGTTNILRSMFSFGYFPGVWGLKADVSEPSIGSIFLGRCSLNRNILRLYK